MRAAARTALKLLASLELAVVLITTAAVALGGATVLEKAAGRECALWYVYHSGWFIGLLGLLAANIVAAALLRMPWKKRHIGFLLAHLGVLLVLVGSLRTFLAGINGQLSFREGETSHTVMLSDRSGFSVFRQAAHGAYQELPGSFAFHTGPVDWPEGSTLDLGQSEGVSLKVLKYYRHADVEENWIADEQPGGKPALHLSLLGPNGQSLAEQWLVGEQMGAQMSLGPAQFQLWQTSDASLREDFLRPPARDTLGKRGVLSVHYEGKLQRIAVDENLGKKIAIGDGGPAVEIVEYLANAQPSEAGRFTSNGDEPRNPLLELRLYLPGKEEPLRQIAFAKYPLLTLDGIHGRSSPVKFWYHHPAVGSELGAEFLHAPDGHVCCRVAAGDKWQTREKIAKGDQIEISPQLKVSVLDYLPHARREVKCYPAQLNGDDRQAPEAAALVEVSADATTHQVWLRRNDLEYGRQVISTPHGIVGLMFAYERISLPFSLELQQFRRGLNPGRMGDASFASTVRLVDKDHGVDELREISMNRPLVYGQFTFYQSSYDEQPGQPKMSLLSVSYDPGWLGKYLGSVLTCLGIFLIYFVNTQAVARVVRNGLQFLAPRRKEAQKVASSLTALLLTCLLQAAPAQAGATTNHGSFDWRPWRYLATQDGGRYKPLDTFATETLQAISNRSFLIDPESGEKLDPVAAYLALLLDWQGSGKQSNPHSSPTEYFLGHAADKWDRVELLPLDDAALRSTLRLPPGQRSISPLSLATAQVRDPKSGAQTSFLLWAKQLGHDDDGEPSSSDRKALELANSFWVYREHRLGRRFAVLPLKGSEHEQWLTVAELLRGGFDDATDPSGDLRKAAEQFQQVRAAYQGGSSEAFNRASAAFLAALGKIGPQLGVYPKPATIALEVAYNHAAPFRVAWMLGALSLCAVLASMSVGRGARGRTVGAIAATASAVGGTGGARGGLSTAAADGTIWNSARGALYLGSWAIFTAAVLAMLVGFGMRMAISGRAPVTNMYESVVFLGLGTALLGMILEAISRKGYVLASAAGVAVVALLLADNCPTVLDPSIRPLMPVLRSNFWLVIHVMTIVLSYAAFALAWVIGNITLGYYLVRSAKGSALAAQSKFTYKCVQVGMFLLVLGTFLGAAWADYSWGRFWGWDPKEVWALVTLLGYLAVLHARHLGWVGELGMAVWSVACFALVVMAWYGVNFVLGTGLHSYGAGSGGQVYVLAVLVAQLLYVLLAVARATGGEGVRIGE